jgi:undecaprenyl diphosphate synthase
LADISPQAIAAARRELGVGDDHICRSIGIIMDGNGRWAEQRGLDRTVGHRQGAKIVRRIVTEGARLGLDALTLYSFSIENWARPAEEVDALMHLYAEYLVEERPTVMEHNIRLRHLGRRDGLPAMVLRELDESVRVSADNTGMFLCLALNYGSRAEITDAVGRIARKVKAGELDPDKVTPAVISASLDSAGVPDPDLVIRTSGEMRVSNFLLWQISYAEFYVTDVYWPDFTEAELRRAIVDFAGRHRRFGGVDTSTPR